MVTESQLFDIFDVIKDKELAFCVLCLRNQDETKLTKPKAFTLFMETFNHKFENPLICYICEAKAESALKFVSMVHFAVAVEKIMKDIFPHYHKYHNTKRRMLELLSNPSTLQRSPFMADVCDCEEMVGIIRERTRFQRTDTLTLFACDEHLDTGQQPAVNNSYNPSVRRPPDPAPAPTQHNLMDNIVLFPAPTNGSAPQVVGHSNAVLYRNVLKPYAKRAAPSGPAPFNIPKDTLSKDLVLQRVYAGDGVVYRQNEVHNQYLYRAPTAVTQPATQDNANGPNLYSEDCIQKLLKEKMQNEAGVTTNESKRMRVESAPSNRTSDVQAASLRGHLQAASLGSDVQAASLRSDVQAASLRSDVQAASLRSDVQAASLRSDVQAASLRSDVQAVSFRSDALAASLRSHMQASNLRNGDRERSLRGGRRAPNARGGRRESNARSSEQTSKEAVMDPKKVDWEDKIPMDLISFVGQVDQNSSCSLSNLIYLPNYGRQILPFPPPLTACIKDVRSEREDKQDSDDDLILVNNAPPVPCIEID